MVEVLRKLWSTSVISRIMNAWQVHGVLEDTDHAYMWGRGTDTAGIILQNYMEDIEEKTLASHQSSNDLKKAFDSTSIPLMDWSLRRLGVPDGCAKTLAQIDVNGTTVVRSPFAEYLWDKLPYRCVRTDGDYPPGTMASTPDSAIVDSFCPERGTGQGEPASPPKWKGIMDIIATGFRILEDKERPRAFVGSEDNGLYPQPSILYADDSKNDALTEELLQKKAELFSAFCIVLGLQLSHGKIRRLFQNFLPNKQKARASHMTVYTTGWVPHAVPIQSTGSSVFLGAIVNMDNSGSDTAEWLRHTAQLARSAILSKPGFSGASKIAVISSSTLNGMVFKAACSVLSHTQLQEVDRILDDIAVDSTHNMFSFPRKLIHIDKGFGGLGIPSFSVQADSKKLQKLFGCLRSQQVHGLAARGLLSRLARKHGFHTSPNQRLIITPSPLQRHVRKLFLDGPMEMLANDDLFICRAGTKDTPNVLTCLLPVVIPDDDKELRSYCCDNNFLNVSDVTVCMDGMREWYLPGPLERIRGLLPTVPPSGPSVLLAGQY